MKRGGLEIERKQLRLRITKLVTILHKDSNLTFLSETTSFFI